MNNLVSIKWLKENLNKENLVIVDCRFNLMDKEYGEKCYNKEHITGAVRVDLENQLSSNICEHGGRHPLPNIDELKKTFESVGISNKSMVVAYDEGDLSGPSRLWWILKYLGHKDVYILDGGIEVFKNLGGETSSEIVNIKLGSFEPNVDENMRVDMFYVRDRLNNENIAIIDSRENIRYRGEFEPVDKKSGHIPGALNYFWMDILDKKNNSINLNSKENLEKHFEGLSKFDEVIVYCGSGITACANSLALSEVGIEHKLYLGSFSDWISYDENIIEIK
ncbi:MAG: sulfurtransferase [Romboutsia sp.]